MKWILVSLWNDPVHASASTESDRRCEKSSGRDLIPTWTSLMLKKTSWLIPPAIITSDAAGRFITQTWMKQLSQSQIFSPQNIASIGPGRILFCSSSLITRDPSITPSVSGVIMFFSQQPYKDVITPLEKEATQHSVLCKPATKQNPPNQTTECDFCN